MEPDTAPPQEQLVDGLPPATQQTAAPTAAPSGDVVGVKRKRDDDGSDEQQANSTIASTSSDDEGGESMIEINLDELEDETKCSVCLSIINNARLVSVCMHRFCAACIETWLRNSKSNSCPACRKPLQSRRDCKPDPRFDELLRLLYGSVEDYEEDVLMPLAEEATARGKATGRELRQAAIQRKQREGTLTAAEIRALQAELRGDKPQARPTTPQQKKPVVKAARAPSSGVPPAQARAVQAPTHSVRRMMPAVQPRRTSPLVPLRVVVPEGISMERPWMLLPPSCTVGVLKAYLRRTLADKVR